MHLLKYIGCFLLFVFLAASLWAQPYSFRHYGVENGLSNNAVMCSLQDKNGFMWFGTKDGLNRFDGYSFKTFRRNATKQGSIGNNFIFSLYEDDKGRLWVGTDKGLYQYLESTEQFRLLPATANMNITKITKDKDGNFWFISGSGLCRFPEATGRMECYDNNEFFRATSIGTASDGVVWFGTSEGDLKRYHSGTNTFSGFDLFHHSQNNSVRWIESLYPTPDGKLLAGTSNTEIKLIDPYRATYTDFTLPCSQQPNLYIRSIQQISGDEFWLGTETGIYAYNIATGKCLPLKKDYNNPYSITDNAVYSFCRDREGGIWVGTYFGGVNYFPRQYAPFTKYFPKRGENSLSGNVVREIQKDRYGQLWIGTEDAGLNKLDPVTGRFTHYQPTGKAGSISFFNIHGLLATGNELWIGTFDHGLDVMDVRTAKVIRHFGRSPGSDLVSEFIYSIYPLSADELLICTTTGLYSYQRKTNSLKWKEGFPSWTWYSFVRKDTEGTIWAASFGRGVFFYNPSTKKSGNLTFNENDPGSLSSDRVNSIFEDSHKNLWFATEEGLCRWNAAQQNFTRYGTADGFPSDFILSLLEDSRQNLWISTTKGLVCFSPATGKVQVFSTDNGLLSDQFNYNSAFKDEDGRMYFGSAKGLISFRPEDFGQNTFTAPVYITGFQVNNTDIDIGHKESPLQKSITHTQRLTLASNQSTFSIDFAALGYTAPHKTQYRYQMKGLSETWVDLNTNRRVYFMELPPGRYTFRVKASNGDGIWSGQETKLDIQILPPWWASFWARVAYLLAGLLLVAAVVRYYQQKTEEKNNRKIERLKMAKEKEILEMELAKEKELLEAKVDFFTNVAHEIRTPLTLIKLPLSKIIRKTAGITDLEKSVKIMERNTNRLVDLTNQLLDFRQTEINKFHLSIEKANISLLLEEAGTGFSILAEQNGISLSLNLPKDPFFASVDIDSFNKIIYNLFSNAVKYAATTVVITLLPNHDKAHTFTIQVKSDGYLIPEELKEKIFEPFYRIREAEYQTSIGTGIGLALSRSLTQLHNGVLKLEKPENNMNVFSLTLPVHQDHETPLENSAAEPDLKTKEDPHR